MLMIRFLHKAVYGYVVDCNIVNEVQLSAPLREKLKNLDAEIVDLRAEIVDLRAKNILLEAKVLSLESEKAVLTTQIIDLNRENELLKEQRRAYEEQIVRMEQESAAYRCELENQFMQDRQDYLDSFHKKPQFDKRKGVLVELALVNF